MNSVSPVLTEAEVDSEQVIALEQEQYYPIIVARVRFEGTDTESDVYVRRPEAIASLVRFRFTDEERKLIAEGADLIIGQPHHGSMMPMSTQLAMPGEYPKA